MASRSGGGGGAVALAVVLLIVSVGLFISMVVFASKSQQARKELNQVNRDNERIITPAQRNSDEVRQVISLAEQQNRSLIAYLLETRSTIMSRVTGSSEDGLQQLEQKLGRVDGTDNAPLLAVAQRLEDNVNQFNERIQQLERDLATARADLENEVESKRQLIESHDATVAQLEETLNQYETDLVSYRQSVNQSRQEMDARVERIRSELESQVADLQGQNAEAQRRILELTEQVSRLRGETAEDRLKPRDEATLVDGQIIDLVPRENAVIISRGVDDNLVLGMTFSVYPSGTAVRPDPQTGNLPRGKATIEVISINETTARCRILSQLQGTPVVRGDQIVNPVYDPDKVYKLAVFGNFDTNGDGVASAQERTQIEGLISSWGGEVSSDLAGNTDFLVLGERPILPPRPGPNAPFAVIQEYIRLSEVVDKYDRLFEQAGATSIPVLNQNRLSTLLGR